MFIVNPKKRIGREIISNPGHFIFKIKMLENLKISKGNLISKVAYLRIVNLEDVQQRTSNHSNQFMASHSIHKVLKNLLIGMFKQAWQLATYNSNPTN